jgi:hypothetical protein
MPEVAPVASAVRASDVTTCAVISFSLVDGFRPDIHTVTSS